MSCLIKTNYTSLAMPIKFKNYFYKKLFFNIFFFKIKHLKKQLFSPMKSGNTITFDDCIIEEYGAARILQIKKTPARRRHYKCTSSLVCNPLSRVIRLPEESIIVDLSWCGVFLTLSYMLSARHTTIGQPTSYYWILLGC